MNTFVMYAIYIISFIIIILNCYLVINTTVTDIKQHKPTNTIITDCVLSLTLALLFFLVILSSIR